MKKIMNALGLCAIALALNINVSGQDLPMIRSKDALRTYAAEQLSQATASISTSLPAGTNTYRYVPLASSSVGGLIAAIKGMTLSVDIANPADGLFTWATGNNSDGDTLFFGYNSFNLVQGNGGYSLPDGYGKVTLTLANTVPIKIPGSQYAIIDILDSNGNTTAEYKVDVYNGKVYYPRQLAGTNAILAVLVGDGRTQGTWKFWNATTGGAVQESHYSISLNPSVSGITSLTNSNVIIAVPTHNSFGTNQTVELTSTVKQRIPTVSFYTTENKWFIGAWVRKAGSSDWSLFQPTTNPATDLVSFSLDLLPGVYYIVPIWSAGDLDEPADPYYPPYYGEGEKGGEAVAVSQPAG